VFLTLSRSEREFGEISADFVVESPDSDSCDTIKLFWDALRARHTPHGWKQARLQAMTPVQG